MCLTRQKILQVFHEDRQNEICNVNPKENLLVIIWFEMFCND